MDEAPDRQGQSRLGSGDYRYLVQVLRKAVGDVIEVRLPDGRLTTMRIDAIGKKDKSVLLSAKDMRATKVRLDEGPFSDSRNMGSLAAIPPGFPPIILFQWMLKGPKMDQVVRQATETGVALIVPVAGERCLSRDADAIGDEKTGRWERIVREARQQSGSPVQTCVLSPISVDGIKDVWQSLSTEKSSVAFVLSEAPLARKSLHEYLVNGASLSALAIGPEGGMTVREIELLGEAGFVSIHFRTNILRAETAALYGIAALQSALTELENWQLKE